MNKGEQQKQIQQMMRFIDQEAAEKAEEIITKATSEISALRNQQVRKRKEELKEKFDKMEEEVKIEKKILKSRKYSEMKIKTMRARDNKMNEVKVSVAAQLADVSSNPQYPALILALLTEGLLRVVEKKVICQCREIDRDIVSAQIPKAVANYSAIIKQTSGADLKVAVTLSDENLDGPAEEGKPGCAGGIVLTARNRKIILRNTLDARLGIAFYEMKPTLRGLCFGEREQIIDTVHEKHSLTSG